MMTDDMPEVLEKMKENDFVTRKRTPLGRFDGTILSFAGKEMLADIRQGLPVTSKTYVSPYLA